MAILYGLYAIVAMLSEPLTIPGTSPVAESAAGYTQRPEDAEAASTFNPQAAKRKADAFTEEVRLLELERHQQKDEQQMIAQNNDRRTSGTGSSTASQLDSDSWQDRLEAEARG